jgi:hypothetical protein
VLLYGQVPGREAIATIEADSTVEERPFGAALAESLHSGFSPVHGEKMNPDKKMRG